MPLKKFKNFINENIDDELDPFGEEDWEEVQGVEEIKGADYVEDYNGNMILRDTAVWCDYSDKWCHEDEAIWSETESIFITPDNDEFVWVDNVGWGDGDYVHINDVVWSIRDDKHYMSDDAEWCEYENDVCLSNEAVELENGTHSFPENVAEDYRGKLYHRDTLIWNDEKNGYIYKEK